MTDLSQMSNEELQALYSQSKAPDIGGMVTAEAQRQGVDPDLAMRVARQESGLRASAVSPKGARGPMQLMPATARDLGVNPDDPADNIRGGVTYLKRQLQTFGDPRLAAAAYNAGPGAVRKYGGVPPYAETQDYVDAVAGQSAPAPDLSQMSNDELQALYAHSDQTPDIAPQSAPLTGSSRNGGVTVQVGGPPPKAAPSHIAQVAAKVAAPMPQEAASGFAEPFVNLGHDISESYRSSVARAKAPPSVGSMFSGIGDLPRIASDLAATTGAPLAAAVRPIAGALSRVLPTPSNTHVEWHGIVPHMYVDGKMTPDQARAAMESDLNTALQGARSPSGNLQAARATSLQSTAVPGKSLTQQTRALAPQMPVPAPKSAVQIGALQSAKQAAYQRVDALGAAYQGKAKADLRRTIVDGLKADGIDQGANPGAYSVMKRAQDVLGGKSPVTLTDLDNLRQTAWRQAAGLKGPDKAAERYYGSKVIDMIDHFVDTAQPGQMVAGDPREVASAIREARIANQRYRKVQTVQNELESAKLRAASTYSGGNTTNAIRQELRPLIDPTSNKQMRGLSKDEAAALRRVVQGTPTQNALRYVSKTLNNKFIQAGLAWPTHGVGPIVMESTGLGLRKLGESQTEGAVQKLIELLAGGSAVKRPSVTPRGLIGSGALAAPLARLPERHQSGR